MGVSFSTISLFYSLLLVIVFFSKKRLESLENKVYAHLIRINLIGLILAILCYFFVLYKDSFPFLNFIFSRMYLVYLIVWISLLTWYIYVISYSENEPKMSCFIKKHKSMYRFLFIMCIISSILSFVLPLNYINTNGMVYSYGVAANMCYIYSFICLIISTILMVKNIKRKKLIKYTPLIIYLIFGGLVMVIQKINPSLLLITSTETFITFLMYFTIENPDMKLIAQLNEARDQAEKANNAKSEFLSSMSHEIRTPLNAIVGFSQALKEEDIPETSMQEVDDIIMASQNLLEIVNGILDISKIEANKIEIINVDYNFKKVFDELTILTKARLGEKPIDFRVSYDESIPITLHGDYSRIKQVVLNILTNAVKYTDEGYIEFKVSSIKKDNVCRLIISVEDSGIGIKQENISKLFSKFERFDEERNITIEGTGLGLAITKKLVDLMDGKIVVQSIYGQGSKFTIAIDQIIAKNQIEVLEENDKIEIKEDLSNKRILIVDDNKVNLKVAARLLKDYKVQTEEVSSGDECLIKIRSGKSYDLILLDDMMPRMSGVETLKHLKELNGFNIPTVALTANAITGMREKYLADGFDDYLAKPIDKKELGKVIQKFLSK